MIAEKDIYMVAAAKEMYKFSADQMFEERCRARDDYRKQINTHNRTLQELDEANREIEMLRKRIAELESQNQ